MKKLASRGGITAVALAFAIIGGFIGGLTGYSIGEPVAQRRRDKIRRENSLRTITNGDVEIGSVNSSLDPTFTGLRLLSSGWIMVVFVVFERPWKKPVRVLLT